MDSTSVPEPVSEVKVPVLKRMLSKSYVIALAAVIGGSVLTCIVPLILAVLDQGVNSWTYPFVFAATLLSYGLVALTPAVWFGANRGWKAGILVIVYEVLWLAFIALLIALLAPSDVNLS
ncbi:MAG: hypothetical protein WCQ96_02415 [Patescibacteria group bacterium]